MGLYKKNELTFSFVCIAAYVVLMSVADNFSRELEMEKLITAPLSIVFAGLIFFMLKKNDLLAKHGLTAVKGRCRIHLYLPPLLVIGTVNLWHGITMNYSPIETVLYIISMICVGFLEEMLFRGFLFTALRRDNIKTAVIISSLTFGIGHIVNLLNGAPFFETILQICYASAIGFLFTIIFYRSGSLIPCIITHSTINSLSAFAIDGSKTFSIVVSAILTVVSAAYAVYILKAVPKLEETQPQESLTA